MPIIANSSNIDSMHWLRMPVAGAPGTEYFEFTGIAIFSGIEGKGQDWERGTAQIRANYPALQLDGDHAVLLTHWTIDAHLASICNQQVAQNTGWAIDRCTLTTESHPTPGQTGTLAFRGTELKMDLDVAARDIDAYILRISYRVSLLGRVINAPIVFG